MKELLLLCLCIILYGSATFFKRLGLLELHPYHFLLITGLCYVVITPIWLLLLHNQSATTPYSTQSVIFTIIYAGVGAIAGLILAFLLRDSKNPGMIIIMINLSSLITLMLSCIFLNEQLNSHKIVAVILAVASLVIMNL